MSYLNNFYTAVTEKGLNKDFQLKLIELYFNTPGSDLCEKYKLRDYAKKISLPILKSQAQAKLNLGGIIQPVFGGVADYVDKDNFPVTFWLDGKLELYDLFMDQINVQKTTTFAATLPTREGIAAALNNAQKLTGTSISNNQLPSPYRTDAKIRRMVLHAINDSNIPVYKITLINISVVGINAVVYSSDGTGKPQEITVVFAYDLADRIKIEDIDLTYATGDYGSTDTGATQESDIQLATTSKFKLNQYSKATLQKPQDGVNKPGGLKGVLNYINAATQTIQAIGSTASSIRRAGRSIRGR